MFRVAKRDQLDKPRFVADCYLTNLAVGKQSTPLQDIDELRELVAPYTIWSEIDLPDGSCNVRVGESS